MFSCMCVSFAAGRLIESAHK